MRVPKLAKVALIILVALAWPRLAAAASLTFTWDPASGPAAGYIILAGTAPGVYSHQINVGATTSYTLDGVAEGGTYYFAIAAYDAAGGVGPTSSEISATIPGAAPAVVTGLTLASSVPSPQVVGTTVNWVATAVGGVPPYQYQWALAQSGQWNVGPWTSTSTNSWTPTTAGDYQARVAVRSASSTSITGDLSRTVSYIVTAPRAASALAVTVSASLNNGRNRVATIRVTATDGTRAASGAAITVVVTSPQGVVTTLNETAGNNGSASFRYSLNSGDSGTYRVQATATSDGATGTAVATFNISAS